ncbi:acetolactate synthase 2 small subunit [Pleionea sediminis]|uniref:acetolactate synthase 2 small subunit n=1 Tax=Pleionea sediminis TaxID=2569479 RepID=UPI001184F507|nr:acetolactate synthase 2 small subunit [Pleionea sediminis]
MKASLTMLVRQQLGCLERILRVVRHRGFTINDLSVTPDALANHYVMTLSVESSRGINLLTNQLVKLFEVEELTLDSGQKVKGVNYAKSA